MAPPNRRVGAARLPPGVAGAPEAREGRGAPSVSRRRAPAVLARLRAAAAFALVAGASVAVAWGARRQLMQSPHFAIASIEVAGNDRRTAAAVAAESGLVLGTSLFAADLDAARDRLLKDPWIVDAALVRRLPAAVVVRVTEQRPAALVALDDLYLVAADGTPFKKLEPGDPIDLPLVTGVTAAQIEADREGATRAIARAVDLAAEFAHSALGMRSPLEEIHLEADGSFALVVGHRGTQIVLGGPPFRRKLDRAARVLAELERRGARADAVMLDNDVHPDRVVVRVR